MTAMEPWCVVLDIDDTLYLERDYVRSGFHVVSDWIATNLGVPGFAPRAWSAFERGVRGNTFNLVLEELGLDAEPERIRTLIDVYRRHTPEIHLLPDALACIELLAQAQIHRFAAVTDGPAHSQRAKAAALRLSRWADPIVFTSELGPGMGKPHPEAFRLIQAGADMPGERCVYLSDNPHKDFKGPRSLGWRTIRVRRPGGLHFDAPGGDDIDVEFSDMARIPETLALWSAR